ncbi:MAG: histidine phosphatase family protein [Xanthobacteraceae bacterium]|nr:histidine phosphatase family protein [Xanthobacteraceae bacterium]
MFLRVMLAAALLACPLVAPPAVADDALWTLLKKPGHVVLLRHSNAPGQVQESNDMNFKDCSIQRNLDEAGRAQADRIGNEFRKRGFKQVRLLSSLYCRAMDTAKLTKLGPVTPQPDLNQVFMADILGMRQAGIKGRELLKTASKGKLAILVSHVTNIQAIAGVQLDSGQMAVVHLGAKGEVVVDGKITVP